MMTTYKLNVKINKDINFIDETENLVNIDVVKRLWNVFCIKCEHLNVEYLIYLVDKLYYNFNGYHLIANQSVSDQQKDQMNDIFEIVLLFMGIKQNSNSITEKRRISDRDFCFNTL